MKISKSCTLTEFPGRTPGTAASLVVGVRRALPPLRLVREFDRLKDDVAGRSENEIIL